MKRPSKRVLFVSLSILLIVLVPFGAAAVISNGGLFGGRDRPPSLWVNKPGPAAPGPAAMETASENDTMIFGDYEKDFCLGYLDNFKVETLTGSESAQEADRITRKNARIQEYREYVNRLYQQTMTPAEYNAHYDHLMKWFSALLTLEPEDTPEETLESYVSRLLLKLEEELYYCEHKGAYAQQRHMNIPLLKEALAAFRSLQERFSAEGMTYAAKKAAYMASLEKVKAAMPDDYAAMIQSGHISDFQNAEPDEEAPAAATTSGEESEKTSPPVYASTVPGGGMRKASTSPSTYATTVPDENAG